MKIENGGDNYVYCIVLFHPTEGIEVFEGMREMPGRSRA